MESMENRVANGNEDTIGVEFLEDFDSIMEDIHERLVISRMVSDSVMKGIVSAVEQEAFEKESEVSLLKQALSVHQTGYSESLGSLTMVAKDQVKKMKKEIDRFKGVVSCSELMGFSVMENSLHDLVTTIDKICLMNSSLNEFKQEQELQKELEEFVLQISVKNLQEEFEERLNNQCVNYSKNVIEKIDKISSLRKDLDEIMNSVSNPESHNLDKLHRKLSLDSHVFSSFSRENGVSNESSNGTLDKWNVAQFAHLTKDGLVEYFNTEMVKMKRNHELEVQKMTEDYYSLRREYLKENGSSSPFRKDKELDILKKKIQMITSRLDDILNENKNLSFVKNEDRFNDRLKDLTYENRCLKEKISVLNDHVITLTRLNETNLMKSFEDTFLENLIASEVFKSTLQAIHDLSPYNEIHDSDLEHMAMHEICETIYEEAIKEAESQIQELKIRNMSEHDHLELILTEKEENLKNLIHEKEDLEKRLNLAMVSVEENRKSKFEMSLLLTKEKEHVELTYKEINDLKEKTRMQESLLFEKNKEIGAIKGKLLELSHQNEAQTMEIRKLKNNLKLREEEQREQMNALRGSFYSLSNSLAKFEEKILVGIEKDRFRLEGISYGMGTLVQNVKILKRTSFLYKQQFERLSDTLQLAEAEVDLLGDEVDVLLGLLQKIHIGLDHYSPILQYYPGIMEILSLIQRELKVQSTKPTS